MTIDPYAFVAYTVFMAMVGYVIGLFVGRS